MDINIVWDASADDAPAGYKAAVEAAVAIIESLIVTPVTLTLQFGWGALEGQPLDAGVAGETFSNGLYVDYDQLREYLGSQASTVDDADALMAMVTPDPTHDGLVFVPLAMARAAGFYPADGAGTDAYIALDPGVDFNFDLDDRAVPGLVDAVGVLLHEITHALGRSATLGVDGVYGPLDLFRFSAPGVHALESPGAFSVDGQHLLLAFNDPANGADPADWSLAAVGDALAAFAQVGIETALSETDLRVLDVLGWRLTGPAKPAPPTPPVAPSSSEWIITGQATNAADHWVYIADTQNGTGHGSVRLTGAASSLTNAGTILVNAQVGWAAAVGTMVADEGLATITNTRTGRIYADMPTSDGPAHAIYLVGATHIANDGLIQATSALGGAYGIVGDPLCELVNSSSGVVRAHGEGRTAAVSGVPTIHNAGLIEAVTNWSLYQGIAAIAVRDAMLIENSGVIRALATDARSFAYGVMIEQESPTIINTGVIEAQYAIYQITLTSPPIWSQVKLVNSGKIAGAIVLGDAHHEIRNSGVIAGDIFFGNEASPGQFDGNDGSLYDGRGGTLIGGLFLGYGDNTVWLGDHGEVVYGGGRADLITGGAGDDLIMLQAGANTVDGGGGFNTVSFEAASASVTVDLGTGAVTGATQTTLSHVQKVVGTAFADQLIGGVGDDVLVGGLGDDQLKGGAGVDTASYRDAWTGVTVNLNIVGAQNTGGAGLDTLVSIENLIGSDQADVLVGDGLANRLEGRDGNDLLLGGLGDDMLDGGDGVDTASYLSITSGVTVSLAQPNAQSTGAAGVDILASIENLIGTAFGDTLYGDDGANRLEGNAGNDGLAGGAGDDVLDGGTEADYMVGGAGNDSYIIDNFYDTIIEAAGEGVDVVYASTSYGLGANVEVLYLGAASDSNGVGNALGNTLVGDAHNNYLSGLAGDDALLGGDGADHEYGGDGADYLNGQGGDDWLVGDDGFDRLYGEAGVDVLIGGAGVDLMVGGLGDDGYVVDNGGDLIVENAGEGTEAVYAFANCTLADNVENLWLFDAATSGGGNAGDNLLVANVDVGSTLYGLAGADALVGENGADVLYGGADNDFLNGQAGADTLVGGQGSDYLYGGAGADTFLYTAASDSIGAAGAMDAILDFEIGVDKVNLHGVLGGAGDSVSLLTNSDGTYILVDLGGDGSEDMRILLYHTTGVTMSDLVL